MLDVSLIGKDWATMDAVESACIVFKSRAEKKILIYWKKMINHYFLVLKTKSYGYLELMLNLNLLLLNKAK